MLKKLLFVVALLLIAVIIILPGVRSVETETLNDEVRAAAGGSYITTAIGTTHYEISGPQNGELVVLIHGFASPYYVWDETAPALAFAGYRVIRFDLMGRGYSDRPDVTYDEEFLVRQVSELLDGLNVNRPVNIVGYSMGGVIAAAFANQYPLRVNRVALVAPFNTAVSIGPLGLPVVGDWLAKVLLTPGMPKRQAMNFYKPENFPGAADKFQQQMVYQGFGRAIHSSLKTIVADDHIERYERLGKQNKPTLLLWGEADQVVPFEQSGAVRAALGNVGFVPIAEAGHGPQSEKPEVVNTALINWLAPN